ncbi:MAG: tellurite resistance protein [Rhodobacteraceae bacterium HLUCCA12]|nr:MAG: tellurite resistance protein [Rhodobacteraceae bacterium HLUCCA12]
MTEPKRHFPPPPPLVSRPPGLWRRTPPAIFPPVMGLLGLGLGWRLLGVFLPGTPVPELAEAALGGIALLYAFCAVAWLAKPLRRPGVVIEELQILPGRAGVVASVLCLSLLASVLVPYAPAAALVMVAVASALLLVLGVLVLWVLAHGPEEGRTVTPVFHLVFVGHVLAPLTLVPLGYTALSAAILTVTMLVALSIWVASAVQLWRRVPPAPLRPLLAIHLAPASLGASISAMLGWADWAQGFAMLALAILTALIVSGRWLLEAGFSPLWGALTFPLAACATAILLVFGGHMAGLVLGSLLLVAGTALTATVALRVMKAWAKGDLAARTNAASV